MRGEGKNEGGKDTGGSFLKDAGPRAGPFLAVLARFKRAGRWGPWRKDRGPTLLPFVLAFFAFFSLSIIFVFVACKNREGKEQKKEKSMKSIIIKAGPGGWGAA